MANCLMLTFLSDKKIVITGALVRIFTFGKALAVVLLLAPVLVHAAGLGRLTVQSGLGQPLNAEIDLVSVRGDEASTLAARLASPDAYQQANLQYNHAVTGLKLSIEKRASGQFYIKVTGSRPINEPFVDLLIELSGAGSRITREYTALLDPPGYGSQAALTAPATPAVEPAARPIAAPAAPAKPAATPTRPITAAKGGQEYGPVAKGETLGKIAAGLKPEGVSLEQMLVGLYRSNPDAFIRNNMNLVKSGKVLRVPDAQELAAISRSDAVQEIRTQVSDWRAYSGRVADAAGKAPEGGSPARGRITAKVDDPGAAGGKDVVRLSKGEAGKGGKGKAGGSDARALQEELVARTKALAEANERIAQLEKTLKDAKKLAELKSPGLTAAQQKAEAAKSAKAEPPKPEPAKPAVTPEPAKQPEAPKPEAAKPEVAKPEAPKDGAATAVADMKKDGSAPAATEPVAQAKPEPKPVPKPKPAPPPPPPPEPDFIDIAMDNLPLIGGGAAALVLGGLGFAALRRRRARQAEPEDDIEPVIPAVAAAAAAAAEAAPESAEAAPASDEVDPVAEAEVYIAYGRDGQAEEILKEAMGKDPAREDVQVKLAEIYASRKDAASFGSVAASLHALTGGAGDNWLKVAALGYGLEPENDLYAAGKDMAPEAGGDAAVATDLDFDLGGDDAATPDIALDAEPAGQATEFGGTQQLAAAADAGVPPEEVPAEPLMPDFNLDAPAADVPAAGGATDIALDAGPAAESGGIDFSFDLPATDVPAAEAAPVAPAEPAPAADGGMDFKIDVGDLNINLDDPGTAAAPAQAKDGHWYDVQQKFDLAKAYQEMGDKDGAREILQEVINEGDDEQKDQAQKLLSSLG